MAPTSGRSARSESLAYDCGGGSEGSAGELEAWDSLAHLSVVAALEETYGVTCSMAEMGELRSVAAIRSFLGSRAVVA